jgi:hypothetical protein
VRQRRPRPRSDDEVESRLLGALAAQEELQLKCEIAFRDSDRYLWKDICETFIGKPSRRTQRFDFCRLLDHSKLLA